MPLPTLDEGPIHQFDLRRWGASLVSFRLRPVSSAAMIDIFKATTDRSGEIEATLVAGIEAWRDDDTNPDWSEFTSADAHDVWHKWPNDVSFAVWQAVKDYGGVFDPKVELNSNGDADVATSATGGSPA